MKFYVGWEYSGLSRLSQYEAIPGSDGFHVINRDKHDRDKFHVQRDLGHFQRWRFFSHS